jgi:hypothetical protein
MDIKEHLDITIKLWYSTIEELNELGTFLHQDRVNSQFYRRFLIRGIISVIETYLNITNEIIKIKVIVDPNIQLRWEELAILNEKTVRLNDRGKVRITDEFHRLEPKLKFTLTKFAEVFDMEAPDFQTQDFDKLKQLIKRRNQFTHPKTLDHLFVTNNEVKDIIQSFSWFLSVHGQINLKFLEWLKTIHPTYQ